MKYRELGRTGLKVGEIGMGCEGFVDHDGKYTKALFDARKPPASTASTFILRRPKYAAS